MGTCNYAVTRTVWGQFREFTLYLDIIYSFVGICLFFTIIEINAYLHLIVAPLTN